MNRLFSYGTLRNPEIQQEVFGRCVPAMADQLTGYRLASIDLSLLGERGVYPVVVPESGETVRVSGYVLSLLDEELGLADRYEGAGYRRHSVELVSGQTAWVYLASPLGQRAVRLHENYGADTDH